MSRDYDTTFKDKTSKVNLQGAEAYCGSLPHSLYDPVYRQSRCIYNNNLP